MFFSESDIRANRYIMRAMIVGGTPWRCWFCEDSGKFYEKCDKNFVHAVGWIPCPHCAKGKLLRVAK